MDGSDGSEEETNYLTAMVAEEFVKKSVSPFASRLLRKDIEEGS